MILLKVIDGKWMAHIDDMDQLRQGIGLQAYGNRDPKVEYKMLGYVHHLLGLLGIIPKARFLYLMCKLLCLLLFARDVKVNPSSRQEDIGLLIELGYEENDVSMAEEIGAEIEEFEAEFESLRIRMPAQSQDSVPPAPA